MNMLGICKVKTYLTFADALDDIWKVEPPLPGSPLIVFVNSKSGDGHGDRFLRRFKQILNPAQVFDISNGGPKFG